MWTEVPVTDIVQSFIGLMVAVNLPGLDRL